MWKDTDQNKQSLIHDVTAIGQVRVIITKIFKNTQVPQCNKTDVSKSVLCRIYEDMDHYKEYLKLRIDIIANDPNRWLGNSKMQLPTFEYYLKNCVNDKGGKYDFTLRRYSTPAQVLEPISFHSQNKYAMNSKRLYRSIIHSMWMGTAFNYETVVETVC